MNDYSDQPWVVIPTYNEMGNVERMADALLALDVPALRLLFVDDASPDGTGEILDGLAQQHAPRLEVLHRSGDRGLGRAYLTGFRQLLDAGATAIVQMDCDFSHQPQDVPRLLDALAGADLVIGSRYVEGGAVDPTWGQERKALSAWGNFYSRFILGLRKPQDTTGGFRVWRRETLLGMDLKRINSQGYIFQVEMAYVAHQLGYRIIEIPIFFPDRQVGTSKMNLRIQIEAALRVWEVRWRHRGLTPADRKAEKEHAAPQT